MVAGPITLAVLLLLCVWELGKLLLGLTPEQRAAAAMKRMARDAARQARADQRASRRRQQEWFEAVARQRARGHAGFASEAEARAALGGKGGRPSNLDRRRFS
jgi:hypothetical protein